MRVRVGAGLVLLLGLAVTIYSADGPPPTSTHATAEERDILIPSGSTWQLEKSRRETDRRLALRLLRHRSHTKLKADRLVTPSVSMPAITKLPTHEEEDHLEWCLVHPYTPCLPNDLNFARMEERGVCSSPGPVPPRYLPDGWEKEVLEPERDDPAEHVKLLHQGRLPDRPAVPAPALMLFLHRHRPLEDESDPRQARRALDSQLYGGVSAKFGVQPFEPVANELPGEWDVWEMAMKSLYVHMLRGSVKTELARMPRLSVDGLEPRFWPRAHMIVSYLVQAYIYYDTTVFAEEHGVEEEGPDLDVPEALVAPQRELAALLKRGENSDDTLPGASFSWADMFTNNIDIRKEQLAELSRLFPLVKHRRVKLQAKWLRMDTSTRVYSSRETAISDATRLLNNVDEPSDPCERAFVLITVEQQYRFGRVIEAMNTTLKHAAVVEYEMDAWEAEGRGDLGDLWDRLQLQNSDGGPKYGDNGVMMNHLHSLSSSLSEMRGALLDLIGSFDGMTEENCPPVWWWNAVAVWAQAPRPNKGPNGLQFVNVLAMDAFLRRRSFASDLGRSVGGNVDVIMPNHRAFLDAILRSTSVPTLVDRMHRIMATANGNRDASGIDGAPIFDDPLDLGAEREGGASKSSMLLRRMSVALAAYNHVVDAHFRWLQAHMAKAAGYIDQGMKLGKPRGTSGGTVRAGEARVVDHSGGGDVSLTSSDRETAEALARRYQQEDGETRGTAGHPTMGGRATAQANSPQASAAIRCEADEQHEGTAAILVMLHESAAERKLSLVTSLIPLRVRQTYLNSSPKGNTYRVTLSAAFSLKKQVMSGILKDTVADISPGNVISVIPVTKSWVWAKHISSVASKSPSTSTTRRSINTMLPWIQRIREYRSIRGMDDHEKFPSASTYSELVGSSLSIRNTHIGMGNWLSLVEWGPLPDHVISHVMRHCPVHRDDLAAGMSWDDVLSKIRPECLGDLDVLNLTTPMKPRRFSIVSASDKQIEFIMKTIHYTAGERKQKGMVSRMIEDDKHLTWYIDIHRSFTSGPILKGLRYLRDNSRPLGVACSVHNTITVFASGGTWRVAGWAVLTDKRQRICSIATIWILARSIDKIVDFEKLVAHAQEPIAGMDIRIFISHGEESMQCQEARHATATSSIHVVCKDDPDLRGYGFFGREIRDELLYTRQRLMKEVKTGDEQAEKFGRVMDIMVQTRKAERVVHEYSGKEVVFVVGTSLFESEIRHAYFRAMIAATVDEDAKDGAPWDGMPGGQEANRPWVHDGEEYALHGYTALLKTRMSAISRSGYWAAEVYDSNKAVQNGGHLAELATAKVTCDAMRPSVDNHCFVSWSGGVYDITDYLRRKAHPGSTIVLQQYCGKDITEAFALVGHTANAVLDLEKHFVAKLIKGPSSSPIPVSQFSSCLEDAAMWGEICVNIPALGREMQCGIGYLLVRRSGLRVEAYYTMHVESFSQLMGMWVTQDGDALMIRLGGTLFGTPSMVIRVRPKGPQFFTLKEFVSTVWGCAAEVGTVGIAPPYAWMERTQLPTTDLRRDTTSPWVSKCFRCSNALAGHLMEFNCGHGRFSDETGCRHLAMLMRMNAREFANIVRLSWMLEDDPDEGVATTTQMTNARHYICNEFIARRTSRLLERDFAYFSEVEAPERVDGPKAQCVDVLEMVGTWRGGLCSPRWDLKMGSSCVKVLAKNAIGALHPGNFANILAFRNGAVPSEDVSVSPTEHCNKIYEGTCDGRDPF